LRFYDTKPLNTSVMQPCDPGTSVQPRLSPISLPPPLVTPGSVEDTTHQSPNVFLPAGKVMKAE
jgi:hypothetical protein